MKIPPLQHLHDISTFQYVPFILLVVSCCIPWNSTRYVIIYPHNIFVFSVSGVGILVMDFHTRRLSSAIFGLLRLALHPAASLPTASVSFLCMFLVSVQHPCAQSWLVWIVSGFCVFATRSARNRRVWIDEAGKLKAMMCIVLSFCRSILPEAFHSNAKAFPFRQLTEANAEEFQPTERLGRFLSPLLCLCFQQGTRALWSPIKRV